MKKLALYVSISALMIAGFTAPLVACGTKTPSLPNSRDCSTNNSPRAATPDTRTGCGTKTPSPPSTPRK